MAVRQTKKRINKTAERRQNHRESAYVRGSAAPQIDVRTAIYEEPHKKISAQTRKNREKASHMSKGYVAFLAAALCLSIWVLYGYLDVQSANTAVIKKISEKEKDLNQLKLKNDEEYSRILSSVDMEQVKDIAMNKLNMQYAKEGQIIEVEGSSDDYVRQYQEMP